MHALYQAERSPIETAQPESVYQSFGSGKRFFQGPFSADQKDMTECGIVDLSNLSRVGFRGQDAASYLSQYGFELPEQPNLGLRQQDGCWVLRLSLTEYCVLGSIQDFGERVSQLEQAWHMDEHANYLLPRQDSHAWIQLTGVHIAEVMAKLCAVDLRLEAFQTGQIAQTSVARINAIVLNASQREHPSFYLLCDRAAALYLWRVLQDAIQEFNGQVMGINALISA